MPSLPRAVPMLTQPGASVDGWVGEEVDTYLVHHPYWVLGYLCTYPTPSALAGVQPIGQPGEQGGRRDILLTPVMLSLPRPIHRASPSPYTLVDRGPAPLPVWSSPWSSEREIGPRLSLLFSRSHPKCHDLGYSTPISASGPSGRSSVRDQHPPPHYETVTRGETQWHPAAGTHGS